MVAGCSSFCLGPPSLLLVRPLRPELLPAGGISFSEEEGDGPFACAVFHGLSPSSYEKRGSWRAAAVSPCGGRRVPALLARGLPRNRLQPVGGGARRNRRRWRGGSKPLLCEPKASATLAVATGRKPFSRARASPREWRGGDLPRTAWGAGVSVSGPHAIHSQLPKARPARGQTLPRRRRVRR